MIVGDDVENEIRLPVPESCERLRWTALVQPI